MKERFIDMAEVIFEGLIEFVMYTFIFVILAAVLVAVEAEGIVWISRIAAFALIFGYYKLSSKLLDETVKNLDDIKRA